MSRLRNLGLLLFIAVFAAGCANTGLNREQNVCMLVGAAVGAVAGGLIADGDDAAGGAVIGAAAGATAGGLICGGKDSDGDGVMDKNDQCPGTPAGVSVDERGCPIDSDGDGVPDYKDKCPGTPAGTKVNSDGCPLDSDGDGVTDDKDRCPGTPPGVKVDSNGCPLDGDGDGVPDYKDDCLDTPRGQKVNEKGCHIVFRLEGVNFEFNSSRLTREAEVKLDLAVEMLKASSIRVRVEGHTDSVGSESYNTRLSQKRAQAAVDYLVANGVSADRMSPVGYGESAPIASNDTDAGRAKNRRVDFVITD